MDPQFLYLTTIGRVSGQPREIEIWYTTANDKYYVLAEHREQAQWVKNILRNPRVHVRAGEREFDATARVLDSTRDHDAYELARRLENAKYEWDDGLPVEITPDM